MAKRLSVNPFGSVIVLSVVLILFMILFSSYEVLTGRAVYRTDSGCREVEVPYYDVQEYTDQVLARDCSMEKMKYSASGFDIISECLESSGDSCVKKNVYFSLDFGNSENQEGTWGILFKLYGDGGVLGSRVQKVALGALETSKISVTFPLEGTDADKVVSGDYSVLGEATKEVCGNKFHYENVTREITVRKFRTEVSCS